MLLSLCLTEIDSSIIPRRRCLCIHSTSVVQWNHTRSQHFQGLAMLCCSQLLSVSLISNPVQVARLEKHESLGVWQFAKKAFRCWYHWTQVKEVLFAWTWPNYLHISNDFTQASFPLVWGEQICCGRERLEAIRFLDLFSYFFFFHIWLISRSFKMFIISDNWRLEAIRDLEGAT